MYDTISDIGNLEISNNERIYNGCCAPGRPGTGTGWSERLRENSELHCSSKNEAKPVKIAANILNF